MFNMDFNMMKVVRFGDFSLFFWLQNSLSMASIHFAPFCNFIWIIGLHLDCPKIVLCLFLFSKLEKGISYQSSQRRESSTGRCRVAEGLERWLRQLDMVTMGVLKPGSHPGRGEWIGHSVGLQNTGNSLYTCDFWQYERRIPVTCRF